MQNGKARNVEATSAHIGQDIRVYAYKEIRSGDQLFLSYNECLDTDCDGLFYSYGTQEILSDYGFVEQFPQRWIFDNFPSFEEEMQTIVFELDVETIQDPYDPSKLKEELQVTWHSDFLPDLMMINVMQSHLDRLEGMRVEVENDVATLSSGHEQCAVLEYFNSLQTALQQAILWSREEKNQTPEKHQASKSCPLQESQNSSQYEPFPCLAERYDLLDMEASIAKPSEIVYNCHPHHEVIGDGYEDMFESFSQYQSIEFRYGEENDDTCLWLSGWAQTCTSFRQYHEALVHYPASFLKDLKRVAFIGGGDNMILHEILKYPTIEFVLGMELDQQVVRDSFMNLGTRPYLDDSRVEWWFGDATKSLLLLPESYFGSFDLVLIDLQTFVADGLEVVPGLSIMKTMKLLMKPDGVIAKNEDFPNRQVTDFAKYTVDLEYTDLPQICRQSITIGSNGVDFTRAKQYSHSIDNIYLKDSLSSEGRYDEWYGFRANHVETIDPGVDDSDRAPHGLMLIIEAENLEGGHAGPEEITGAVESALGHNGIEVLSVEKSSAKPDSSTADTIIMTKDGYVALRMRGAIDYVSIDVCLWNKTEKINSLKSSILSSIGGSEERATSYRFVTGGMNGYNVAPFLMNHNVGIPAQEISESKEMESHHILPWSYMLSLFKRHEESSVLVLCGSFGATCESLQATEKAQMNVVPLFTCDNVIEEDSRSLYTCEVEYMKSIRDNLVGRVRGIIVDETAVKQSAQVLSYILTSRLGQSELLDKHLVVFTSLNDVGLWRKHFLRRFLTEVAPFHPSKEVVFQIGKEKFGVFSAGNEKFYLNFVNAIREVEKQTSQAVSIVQGTSGEVRYSPDFDPPFFNNGSYDNSAAYRQWQSQRAVAFQTLLQFELDAPKSPLRINEEVLFQYSDNVWMGEWGLARITGIFGDDTYSLTESDGYEHSEVSRNSIRQLDFNYESEPRPVLQLGTRVLIGSEEEIWRQGFVVSRIESSDVYKVRVFNNDGHVVDAHISNLMPQFEATHVDKLDPLSPEILRNRLIEALSRAMGRSQSNFNPSIHQIGDGCVMVAFFDGGSAILQWGGGLHFDVNLVLDQEEDEVVDILVGYFVATTQHLLLQTRDEQPRGYGSVVNFSSDQFRVPIWWHPGNGSVAQ